MFSNVLLINVTYTLKGFREKRRKVLKILNLLQTTQDCEFTKKKLLCVKYCLPQTTSSIKEKCF